MLHLLQTLKQPDGKKQIADDNSKSVIIKNSIVPEFGCQRYKQDQNPESYQSQHEFDYRDRPEDFGDLSNIVPAGRDFPCCRKIKSIVGQNDKILHHGLGEDNQAVLFDPDDADQVRQYNQRNDIIGNLQK